MENGFIRKQLKIGITGVAGMLGAHLSEILISYGYEIIGIDDLRVGTLKNLDQVLSSPNFRIENINALDKDLLQQALINCDVIVHLAAVKKVVEKQSAFETLNVNVQATKNVLEIAKETGASVLFASTSDVYGVSESIPFKEDQNLVIGDSTSKRWAYAASKIYSEHLCFSYYKDMGVPIVILRYFGGFSEKSAFIWSGGHIPVFIDQIKNKKIVTIHGDGKQTRSMGHAIDLAFGTYLAIKKLPLCIGEIINIGNNEEISVLDSAFMIAEELNVEKSSIKFEFIPEKEVFGNYKDLRRRVPDLTKAKKLLNYEPKISFKKALKMIIKNVN